MKTKPHDPINPTTRANDRIGDRAHGACGLTKREWFTGMSLEGLLSDHDQMRQFETAARTAAKVIFDDKKKAGITSDLEEETRLAFDTMIAYRSVEIADIVIQRLNATVAEEGEGADEASGSPKQGIEAVS